MLVSGGRAAGSGRSLAAGSVQPRALSAPYTADFDASPCISCFSFASYNAVTSEYVFVEVGGVEPAWANLCQRWSEDILPAQGLFLVVPVDARRVPGKPEKCVKPVSPCQSCVK